jgi:hypothetical protein
MGWSSQMLWEHIYRRGVRGVKDGCQRFRLEMQMLEEKAEDTRKREAEVKEWLTE